MPFPHWALFQVIDEDLLAFSRQVEFDDANFPTYSVTLTQPYLSICSEIDEVAKLICQREQLSLPNENINEYRKALTTKYPNLGKLKITIRPMARQILPWEAWDQNHFRDRGNQCIIPLGRYLRAQGLREAVALVKTIQSKRLYR